MRHFTLIALTVVLIVGLSMGSAVARRGLQNSNLGNAEAGFQMPGSDENVGPNGKFRFHRPFHHRPVLKKIFNCMKNLDLSDETKEEIKPLLVTFKENRKARWEAYRALRKEYWVTITAPELDETVLAEIEAEMIDLKAEHMNAKFDLAIDIRNLLSADELAELAGCFEFNENAESPVDAAVDGADDNVGCNDCDLDIGDEE